MLRLGFDLRKHLRLFHGCCRVFARSKPFGLGNTQDNLGALDKPLRCFVLNGPNRRQAHHHFRSPDGFNWHALEIGTGIVVQGVQPLLIMLGVSRCGQTVDMHLAAWHFERGHLALGVISWVQPRLRPAPAFQSSFTPLVQRCNIHTTKSKDCTQRPTFSVLMTPSPRRTQSGTAHK